VQRHHQARVHPGRAGGFAVGLPKQFVEGRPVDLRAEPDERVSGIDEPFKFDSEHFHLFLFGASHFLRRDGQKYRRLPSLLVLGVALSRRAGLEACVTAGRSPFSRTEMRPFLFFFWFWSHGFSQILNIKTQFSGEIGGCDSMSICLLLMSCKIFRIDWIRVHHFSDRK